MATVAYTKGLHELGDGLYAYLQPDGGWGWSNSGPNDLLPDNIPIIATAGAVEVMRASPPQAAHLLFNEVDLGPEFEAFAKTRMRRFDFAAVTPRMPTDTFEEQRALTVGDRQVHLLELGPAHTNGDAIAYVPDADAVFTGDLLFIEGTPLMWAESPLTWPTSTGSSTRTSPPSLPRSCS